MGLSEEGWTADNPLIGGALHKGALGKLWYVGRDESWYVVDARSHQRLLHSAALFVASDEGSHTSAGNAAASASCACLFRCACLAACLLAALIAPEASAPRRHSSEAAGVVGGRLTSDRLASPHPCASVLRNRLLCCLLSSPLSSPPPQLVHASHLPHT